jgi:hypothetical protein
MKSNAASKLSLVLGLLIVAAATLPGAESVAYVVGQQNSGYTGPFIGQYDELFVGNPRKLSYGINVDLQTNLGTICSGDWQSYAALGNTQNDNYDFNCVASTDDITNNSGNVGFYVGGLNQNGVTVALCYVTDQADQLCDSDTIDPHNLQACLSYVQCS